MGRGAGKCKGAAHLENKTEKKSVPEEERNRFLTSIYMLSRLQIVGFARTLGSAAELLQIC